ncbi:ABC transporter permease [Alkalicoccobacillus porphyridii]|uniref:ABC transporter permease n=1 Tax=Alkalicoccobacillus porphyridii TaxID=2597270 RepID=A0A554A2D6_9BACI|nr:ABC transporter permease [Alkalicoccobacillus porphyridii]TSB47848.1 ABC transporter permease [Alkalicoccobacillus porphyridii]
MLQFVIKRMLIAIPVILGCLTLVFFLIHFLPGSVADLIAGEEVSAETISQIEEKLGLNQSLGQQYVTYLLNIIQGNLGQSFVTNEPVLDKLLAHFPATLTLTIASTIVAITLGVVLGVLSAVYSNTFIDNVVRVISLFGISMPNFWIGIILIMIFSVQFNWFPSIGSGSLNQLVLPALALGISGAGVITRLIRNSMLDVLNNKFVTTLRSKGLSERKIIIKHVLRNAILPTVTVIGILFGEMLAGSVVTETVFSRQGVGTVIIGAINQKDIPVLQGAILLISITYITINLLVDVSYSVIDPRIKREA